MQIAWVCDTAYQILNCIIYTRSNGEDTVDLYLGHQFVNSEAIEKKLRETGLFRRIVPYRPLKNERGAAGTIKKMYGIVSPRYRLGRMLIHSDDLQRIPNRYDAVFISVPAYFQISLVFFSKPQRICYFDDGMGSYFGDVSNPQKKTRVMYAFLGHNLKKLQPDALYLNQPDFCQSKMDCPRFPLPELNRDDSDAMELLSKIFNYKRDGYYTKYRFLYLTQPNDDGQEKVEEVDEKIIRLLAEYGNDVLLRPHPRQKQVNAGGLLEDCRRDMWELVCADQIRDDHVLIAAFSTSQIIPKLFYNKEPYIIFLYNLYPMLVKPENRTGMLNLTETIKHHYRKPEKVFAPDTFEALASCMRRIAGGGRKNES